MKSNIENMKKVNVYIKKLNELSKDEKDTESYKEFKSKEYSPKDCSEIDSMFKLIDNEMKMKEEIKKLMYNIYIN